MRNVSPVHFEDNDQDAFDDVDELFNQLERFEPPADMVKRIMDAVSKLPAPHLLSQSGSDKDSLIVRSDNE